MSADIFERFEKGTVTAGAEAVNLAAVPWKAHPEFPGVFLKNLVTSEQTGGLFSCHLVRIEPGHAIGRHTHRESLELHEVMAGSGVCLTEQGTMPYHPGCMAVIPRDTVHEVQAGGDGLCLFAKFVSARAE